MASSHRTRGGVSLGSRMSEARQLVHVELSQEVHGGGSRDAC